MRYWIVICLIITILISVYDHIEFDASKFTFLDKPISITRLLQIVKDCIDQSNTSKQLMKNQFKIIEYPDRKISWLYCLSFRRCKLGVWDYLNDKMLFL